MQERFYHLNTKKIGFFLIFLCFFSSLYCIDNFEEGKKYLSADQPDKAVKVLLKASKNSQTDSSVYLYLGVAYFRIGKYSQALNYLAIGEKKDFINRHLYFYNIGNIYFLQNKFAAADKFYSDSINSNDIFAPAFLNRANARVKEGNYNGALQDYKNYLNLESDSVQRANIEKMISLLEGKVQEEEQKRIAEEERKKAEEAKLIAEEEARKAAEEARKAAEEAERLAKEAAYKELVDEMDSNLSSVEDADSVSTGADDTIDYSEDDELD